MKIWLKIFLFCISSFVFIGCDRATKDLAKEHLKNKESISYLHDTFRLEYAENTGAAMSFGDNLPKKMNVLLLSILPLIFLIILFAYTIKNAKQFTYPKMFSIALIFSGGIGNIIDRIFFDRHVPDFMNLGIQNLRTGIFNFADVCVTIGAMGLMIFYRDKYKTGEFKKVIKTSA
ncbi:MAG: signal peptidase II [Bacteroidota bacterium]|nr:signal peptidase II [Bacteroidota bacterium]